MNAVDQTGVGGTDVGRIAGAPISWGVSEVPGWGYQLSPDGVLTEMREVGLSATEFGPDGFLPTRLSKRFGCSASITCGRSAGSRP